MNAYQLICRSYIQIIGSLSRRTEPLNEAGAADSMTTLSTLAYGVLGFVMALPNGNVRLSILCDLFAAISTNVEMLVVHKANISPALQHKAARTLFKLAMDAIVIEGINEDTFSACLRKSNFYANVEILKSAGAPVALLTDQGRLGEDERAGLYQMMGISEHYHPLQTPKK